jgi:hypothetical protein
MAVVALFGACILALIVALRPSPPPPDRVLVRADDPGPVVVAFVGAPGGETVTLARSAGGDTLVLPPSILQHVRLWTRMVDSISLTTYRRSHRGPVLTDDGVLLEYVTNEAFMEDLMAKIARQEARLRARFGEDEPLFEDLRKR